MHRTQSLLLSFLLLLSGTAFAQSAKDLIPRDLLFQPAEKMDVQISPNGDRISYRMGTELYSVLVEKPDSAIRIDTDGPVFEYRWLATNKVAGVMTLEGKDRLFVSDLDPETPLTVLPESFSHAHILATSTRYPEQVVFSLTFPDTAKNGMYNVDMLSGRLKKIELPTGAANGTFTRWYFDNQLELVAASRQANYYHDDVFYKTKKGKWQQIVPKDSSGIDTVGRVIQQVMSVSHDGRFLYFVNNFGREFAVVKSIDRETGREKILKTAEKHDLLWAGALLDNNNNHPQAVVGYYGEMKRYFLDPSGEIDFQILDMAHKGDISFAGRSLDDRYWLIRYMDGGPLDYYLYDHAMLETKFLFSDHPQLDPYPLAERRPLMVKARDGLELPCQLYLPAGSDADKNGIPDEPLPTIMYVHGGPWIGFLNNSWFTNRNFQLLADRGYAVIVAEFRSATGYGKIFLEKSNLEWGAAMQEDLVDIAKEAKKQGIAAPDRVALWGWSYGGYATLASLAYYPDEFACGVGMYGVYDLEAFINNLPPDEEWWRKRVGNPDTEEGLALLKAHSPVHHADKIQLPLLLTHGGNDQVTPQSQSDAMFKALQGTGRTDIPYFVFPDEGHDYRTAQDWVAFWAITEQFLAQYLGGKYQPMGDDLKDVNMEMVGGEAWLNGLE